MNKEQQDLAWHCLPREFRNEVKKEYRGILANAPWELPNKGYLRGRLRMMRELFGEYNLTSNVEGDEMLAISRKRVQEMYAATQLEGVQQAEDVERADHYAEALRALFGEKCLPDADSSNVEKLEKNEESNPAEPKFKFKVGETVLYNGAVHKIVGTLSSSEYYLCGHEYAVAESDLESYAEPKEKSRNLSQNVANCDKQFDNILKTSFSQERRLNIAACNARIIRGYGVND